MSGIFRIIAGLLLIGFHLHAQPPSVDSKAPNIQTVSTNIHEFDLYATLSKKPVLLIFYRGFYSSPCNRFLQQIHQAKDSLQKYNVEVVIVTTDNPDNLLKTQEKFLGGDKSFMFLYDYDHKIIQAYNVGVKVSKSKENFYKVSGLANGHKSMVIPMSATFLIDTNQRITFAHYSKKIRKRPSVSSLLEQVRRL